MDHAFQLLFEEWSSPKVPVTINNTVKHLPRITFLDFCCLLRYYGVLDPTGLDHLDVIGVWCSLGHLAALGGVTPPLAAFAAASDVAFCRPNTHACVGRYGVCSPPPASASLVSHTDWGLARVGLGGNILWALARVGLGGNILWAFGI